MVSVFGVLVEWIEVNFINFLVDLFEGEWLILVYLYLYLLNFDVCCVLLMVIDCVVLVEIGYGDLGWLICDFVLVFVIFVVGNIFCLI